MNVLEGQTFRFADVEVDTRRGCLRRGDGAETHLRRKSFQVLVYLLEQSDRLVTKNELIENVWNDVAVTDDVLVQCVKEIRRSIGDDPHQPRFIKTVPKAGYRFIGALLELPAAAIELSATDTLVQTEEITRVEVEYDDDHFLRAALSKQKPSLVFQKPKNRPLVFALFALVLATTGFSVFYFSKSFRAEQHAAEIVLPNQPGKKSIAVMRFENQSQTTDLEWLREGLADMLITNFSRSPKLKVLSRQQLYVLLGRNGLAADEKISIENAADIARKALAEQFVAGSYAQIGDAIRIDAKLYDAQTGELQAVESAIIEKPKNIFSEIDLLSLKLANRLDAAPFEQANQANIIAAMTGNLEAYRYYSLGVDAAQSLHNKEAVAFLEKAVALDSQFAMAYARIGYIYTVTWNFPDKAKPYLEKAFALSDRLTEKDRLNIAAWYSIANLDYPNAIEFYRQIVSKYPTEIEAYLRLGNLLRGEEQTAEAEIVFKQGLAVDADAPLLYNALGTLYSTSGRHDEAIQMHRRYVALAPQEANAHDSLGMSFQWAGFYPDAIAEYRRALELKPDFDIAFVHLANAHFQTGRYREAINLYEKYIAAAPSDNERARGNALIARVYRRLKNFDAAARAARLAAKNDFYAPEIWLLALERGDRATVGRLAEKVLADPLGTDRGKRIMPRYKFYYRGASALADNQPDEAIANFKEAIRHLPPTYDADAMEDCLAKVYLKLGQFDEAIAEYNRILQLNPNYPLARFHLAQVFEQRGQLDTARENYRLFLDAWKDADADIPEVLIAKKFLGEP